MDAVEPRQHTAASATRETVFSSLKGAITGPLEGAGLGAVAGAVLVGGLLAAATAVFTASVPVIATIGIVGGLAGAGAGAVGGGAIGLPVGFIKGAVNGREQVRAEQLEADLLQARVAGFKAQEEAGKALQMQVAQEVMASQPRPQPQIQCGPSPHSAHQVMHMQPRGTQYDRASMPAVSHEQRLAMASQHAGQAQLGG
jgi:hypothetical protein